VLLLLLLLQVAFDLIEDMRASGLKPSTPTYLSFSSRLRLLSGLGVVAQLGITTAEAAAH
jgi:hypothetical protein